MKVKVINLDSRADRLTRAKQELESISIYDFERFPAYSKPDAFRGNALSHVDCIAAGSDLIFEDDIQFEADAIEVFSKALGQLPEDAHILYLGGNVIDHIERYSENLFRCTAAWGSYAIYYTAKGREFILANYDPNAEPFVIYDEWLRVRSAQDLKAYIVSPIIAWTTSGFSDVNGRTEDYTPIMKEHARINMK